MQTENYYHFGYVPMIAEWRMYKTKNVTFYELCIGEMKIAKYYIDTDVSIGQPKFKVEGLATKVREYIGHFETEKSAKISCFHVAKFVVSQIKSGHKVLTFQD
jgi:hypothetical protein